MPQQNTPALSYEAGTGLTRWRLGKHNTTDDTVDLCGATDLPLGFLTDDVDLGEIQGIRLFAAGKAEGVAGVNNVAMGERLYTAANGKLTNVPVDGCFLVGIALQASTADGDVIDVLPFAVPLPIQDLSATVIGAALTDSSAGTANTTVQALADPTDSPATADALRDDLVANLLPALRNNFADLTARCNELRTELVNIRADLVASKTFLT